MNKVSIRGQRIELTAIAYIIIAITLGVVAGRIAVVRSNDRETAFLSANDRSRWCTIAALVEDGTYEIDRQLAIKDSTGRRRPWSTIDRVRHPGRDGLMHDYSSKPPLFSTMVAGVYWVVRFVSEMSLTEQPIYIPRIVLALVNLPMLLVMLVAVWRSVLDCYAPDSAKLFGLSVACFGTALLPMSVSLNNHLPAAMSTAVVLSVYLSTAGQVQIKRVGTPYFIAGLAAAFAVANELPALSMLVIWTVLFLRQQIMVTLSIFLPAACLVGFAFFITNQLAHHSFFPPYMHRSDGALMGTVETSNPAGVPTVDEISAWLGKRRDVPKYKADFVLAATSSPARWIVDTKEGNLRYAIVKSRASDPSGSPSASSPVAWNVHQWDNWYDYPGSYWTTPRHGVDRGEENRWLYFFNLSFGYYGLFSLTPVWLLLPIGLRMRLVDPQGKYRFLLAASIAIVTLICIGFYVSRPLIDRNYGGVSCCFRWLLWLTPLWIWAMMPAITRSMLSGWAKPVVLMLLVASVFSAATALENPWQHPWIYRFLSFLGWLDP